MTTGASVFIDGRLRAADRAEPVLEAATGEPLGDGASATAAEVDEAVTAARAALAEWSSASPDHRAEVLGGFAAALQRRARTTDQLVTRENGMPMSLSRGANGAFPALLLNYYADLITTMADEEIRPSAIGHTIVRREPVGVVAAITPWNFPLAMIARKVAPALAAGCTTVVKPAEQTPLCALALAALAEEAGLPPGVLNVITGEPTAIGGELCANPAVRKLSFTGSTEVGRLLMAQCAPTVKKLSLELGGNAPFIVFDDADLDAAVEGALAAKFRNTGQTCVCANRFYVQAGIYDEFAHRFANRVAALEVGPGERAGVAQGPLIDAPALDKVEALLADALGHGAVALLGGRRHALGGTFFEPTVLTGVTPAMRLSREEIFGPVAALYRFASEEEAIALANATESGLAAYFYTRDIGRGFRVAEALEYGMVGINTGLFSNEVAPFGGIKQSGLGREGSKHGLDEYLEIKSLCFGIG